MANGLEFKSVINDMEVKPDLICIQESWLKPRFDFVIKGYVSERRDREEGNGGGCITLIKEGMHYRSLGKGVAQEYVVVEVWVNGKKYVIINFYNPCKKLVLSELEQIEGLNEDRVIWCGDFNAQSMLWGGLETDSNGMVMEDLIDRRNLVCLNDGGSTRIDVATGKESVLDLTMVSDSIAGSAEWEVLRQDTIGSDHYPIMIYVNVNVRGSKVNQGNIGRWGFDKANWEEFMSLSEEGLKNIIIESDRSVEMISDDIVDAIQAAANKCIPKRKGGRKNKIVPWWNEECASAIRRKRKAFSIVKKTHNFQDLIEYKKAQAEVRKIVRKAKKEYWMAYCDDIGKNTPVEEVWGMIKKMKGIQKSNGYPVLSREGEIAVEDGDKVEMFLKAFIKVNSSENLTEQSKKMREVVMKEYPEIKKKKEAEDNLLDVLFSMSELKNAVRRMKQSTTGMDGISYCMMKHFSEISMEVILTFYNRIWMEGIIPQSWKEALIIPIKKPGKDPSNPINYRPIALTSHLCKVMERMLTDRLIYHLEKMNWFSSYQSGFRCGRGTMDSVVLLEDEIRKAFINKESVIAVFFDIEKAYDMLWKEGLLIKLQKMSIKGRMYNWIKEFLIGRSIRVKIGGAISSSGIIDNGTPQGSVISPLLFIIMINDVFSRIDRSMGKSLFADDGAIWFRGKNIEYNLKKMQYALNEVEKWSGENGFKFSVEKTKVIVFTKMRRNMDVKLKLYKKELERVRTVRFLGVWFDNRLNWRAHIEKMVGRCKRVVNVMRCISGQEWGADRLALKTIYISMIRSIMDYGCMVYGSANKSHLIKIERIQSQALRICCGAYSTSPVSALQVEMGEMPLQIRRQQLMASYWANLRGQREDHPTRKVLSPSWEHEKRKCNSFGWSVGKLVRDMRLEEVGCAPIIPLSPVPLWVMPQPEVDLSLLEKRQKEGSYETEVYNVREYIGSRYGEYMHIFTDASKDSKTDHVGSAFIIPKVKVYKNKRITDCLSVYTGEMYAIIMAIRWIREVKIAKAVICSDCSSALISLKEMKSETRQDMVIEIIQELHSIKQASLEVQFLWVPAHIGLRGNEEADALAKKAIEREIVDIQILYSRSEIKSIIKRNILKIWQQYWDNEIKGRHMHQIQSIVGKGRITGRSRYEENMITRLRLGHTRLNSTLHLIGKNPTGLCEACEVSETVEHVVMHCRRYKVERKELKKELNNIGVKFTIKNVLKSDRSIINLMVEYMGNTGLNKRI